MDEIFALILQINFMGGFQALLPKGIRFCSRYAPGTALWCFIIFKL